mmetsp:Transcript_57523/g.134784  ORF Transcript_57523/g.134784 Transcript_57523/m.134784 type:complete len:229 (+) Transcript_57523:1220-1906(+)
MPWCHARCSSNRSQHRSFLSSATTRVCSLSWVKVVKRWRRCPVGTQNGSWFIHAMKDMLCASESVCPVMLGATAIQQRPAATHASVVRMLQSKRKHTVDLARLEPTARNWAPRCQKRVLATIACLYGPELTSRPGTSRSADLPPSASGPTPALAATLELFVSNARMALRINVPSSLGRAEAAARSARLRKSTWPLSSCLSSPARLTYRLSSKPRSPRPFLFGICSRLS